MTLAGYYYFRTIPQHIRPGYHNVRDRQTDGRTTYDSNTALALRALCGKNVEERNAAVNGQLAFSVITFSSDDVIRRVFCVL